MEKPYKRTAPCRFCRFYGRISSSYEADVCRDCEVRLVRERLDDLRGKAVREHDHRYLHDYDEEVRNCAHCEYALPFETIYHAAQYHDDICCALDADHLDKNGCYPERSAFSVCDRWSRAVDISA